MSGENTLKAPCNGLTKFQEGRRELSVSPKQGFDERGMTPTKSMNDGFYRGFADFSGV